MLRIEEFKEVDIALHKIEAILYSLPRVNQVEKTFVFTRMEVPDPIRYICKGNRGEYALVFTWEHIKKWQGNYEILGAFLEEEIIRRSIYPESPKVTYICTNAGLLKV